jgi:hypothetical protein
MEQEIINIIEIGLTLLAALIAWFRHRSANQSELTTNQVISYFDPADDTVTTAPDAVPGRSWKMTDSTKRWLTFDHSPIEQESLLRQVAEAETGRLDTYTISVPSAWYDIEYGLIKGSGKTDDHA